jgi:RNA polymerase sigma-70 factor (ECF subfamily)
MFGGPFVQPEDPKDALTVIPTLWTVVRQAHGGVSAAVADAHQQLLERYGKAVKRYLLGALRDADAAEELTQEFALRMLRGDLQGANPQRGRFRDFVKGVLSHLVADYYRAQRRQPRPLPAHHLEAVNPTPEATDSDQLLRDSWRDELLSRAWKALAQLQEQTGSPFHTVLWHRAQHPEQRSAGMAQELTAVLGKPVSAAWVRQMLHRARTKFAQFLVTEVLHTLESPTAYELEEELGELGLLEYCRPGLDALGHPD